MQELTTTVALTMTSKEMAELTEKRHDNVKRSIETLVKQGVIAQPQIEEVSNEGSGPKSFTVYRVGKRDSFVIVAQLSPEFTARLVDRWQALEQKLATPPVPQVRDPRTAMMIETLIKLDQVEQEQARQSTELAKVQETVAVLEARTQPENKHFTVMGYYNLIKKPLDAKTAAQVGRKCANLSRSQGMVIGDVSDPRFGNVHSYHLSILEAVADSFEVAA